jgi:hypothetical protein
MYYAIVTGIHRVSNSVYLLTSLFDTTHQSRNLLRSDSLNHKPKHKLR